MTVIRTDDGRWAVTNGSDIVAGPFNTNAEAWRAADRMTGDPISKSEERGEYVWNRSVDAP
ncbi:hypothetical protein [Arvimicrobium flavum]|uniref:hypothetical protein n=1 Tax=Arvimicrobium flavum TaxID=3393320 RepID=UPI00237AA358|nr:hypothetical protein [Mesorhizobium shangrilense]